MARDDKDPLDELIVDEAKEADKAILAGLLKGHVELTKTGKINFTETFYEYADWKKIMIYLLARKAISLKKLGADVKEATMPVEIGKAILVSGDTVSKRLARELKGFAEKNQDGYFIPNYRLLKCRSKLEMKDKEEK